jgi:hypothetical protein
MKSRSKGQAVANILHYLIICVPAGRVNAQELEKPNKSIAAFAAPLVLSETSRGVVGAEHWSER